MFTTLKPLLLPEKLADKQVRAELQKYHSLLCATLDSTADGILVVDGCGKIVSFNKRFAEMWRIPDEVLKSRDRNLVLAFVKDQLKEPEWFQQQVRGNNNQPDKQSYDLMQFKDGRYFTCYSQLQRKTGQIVGRAIGFRDITSPKLTAAALLHAHDELFMQLEERTAQLRQANEQLRKEIAARTKAEEELKERTSCSRATLTHIAELNAELENRNALEKEKEIIELKSRFISMASHEFRTPLATILIASDLLKAFGHQFSDDKKLQQLNKIQTSVKNMNQLLEDVLLVGKAESGRMEFKPVAVNLEAFCLDILSEIELTYNQKHTLVFDCQRECLQGECSIFEIDQKLMRQMLTNLLSNAVKYSPQESTVHFKLICQDKQAIFQIRDEGIGIPASDQSRLFEVFHRATNVGNISGTGLGMAIVKQAVELHGGSISFESEVGVGTTFTVCVPTSQYR